MEFPTLFNWTSPFPFYFARVVARYFSFLFNFNRLFCKLYAAFDLGVHCFTMSHKKDAILIWV